MATSALDMFTPRYAGQLSPKAKHILAGLPANVVQLASFDAHKAADDKISKLCESPADDESLSGPIAYWNRVRAQARKQLARDVPALNALSDKDLDVVIMVARSAMIAGKHGLVPTDTAVLTRTYEMGVDALAWAFLYHKLRETPPTTPLREMFPADELGLAGADPATPVGDVLPHDALVQGCRDACAGATEILDVLEMESYERFNPAAESPQKTRRLVGQRAVSSMDREAGSPIAHTSIAQ
jgi:hypothetical protein